VLEFLGEVDAVVVGENQNRPEAIGELLAESPEYANWIIYAVSYIVRV
jgi:hypothetical protein